MSDEAGPTVQEHGRTPRTQPRKKGAQAESAAWKRGPKESVRSATSTPSAEIELALEASSVGRMRVLSLSMMALAALGVGIVSILEGDAWTKGLAQASLLLLAAMYLYVATRVAGDTMDEPARVQRGSITVCVTAVVANMAIGPLSPFGIAVAIALLLFASSTPQPIAVTSLVVIVGGYLLGGIGLRTGLIPLEPLIDVPFPQRWMGDAAIGVVAVLYATAYLAGRRLRHEHARAVENFERAVREASMRAALLREAREAFQHAAGIGAPGRFTDQELDGFKLGPVIGRGGMGEVYAATHPGSGRSAAVKLLRMDALVDRNALTRFEREARIVAAIRSPHVVEVLAVSRSDSVLPYLAMEYLEGVDLATYLRDRGRLSLIEVTDLVSQVAAGLSAAHAAKVVHRDLKPNNIFRTGTKDAPTWKILDFGVSKWMDSVDQTLTIAELVGTPQYMAPEQARGESSLDQGADIYALSAIAYRALTGEPPFTGRIPGILKQITDEMPRAPSSFVTLPQHIDYVIALGLAKDRRQRFQSAFELSAAFTMAAGGNLSPALVARARALLEATPYARG